MLLDLRIEPDLSLASTLPARLYLDPAVLDCERERIFYRSWQWVGHTSRLTQDGDYATTAVLEQPLVLLRDGAELRGFYNVCRHRGGAVAVGEGNRRTLQCHYHGWTYGLDGSLRGTPDFAAARCFDRAASGLVPVPVAQAAGLLFTNLAGRGSPGPADSPGVSRQPPGPSLGELLGEILQEIAGLPLGRMRPVRRVDYELRCNWKVYVDNYLEGYHLPLVHPGLFRALDYSAYRVETRRYHSRQHAPLRGVPDAQALYYWVFPNLMLNIYPGSVQLNLVVPTAVDRTTTVFEWYQLDGGDALPAASGGELASSFAFADEVQREDIAICEQVQRGLASHAYDRGRFCPAHENGVHHFHQLLVEHLSG